MSNHIWVRYPDNKSKALDTLTIMSTMEADYFSSKRYHERFPGGVGDAGKWFPPYLLAERFLLSVHEAYAINAA